MDLNKLDNSRSSFLSVEKDFKLIVERMLANKKLKKLLFYDVPECQYLEDLTQEQTLSMINKNIRLVPKIKVDPSIINQVIIGFDNYTPNASNPEFRDNLITFDVLCPFDQWNLGDYQLRPYKIMGELDAMFNKARLTGIGKLEFLGASQVVLTEELGGYSMIYQAIHFTEDKVK